MRRSVLLRIIATYDIQCWHLSEVHGYQIIIQLLPPTDVAIKNKYTIYVSFVYYKM